MSFDKILLPQVQG